MNKIIIRKANPTDLDQLVIFEQACFTSDKISRRSYQTLLKKTSAEFTVVEMDQKIIGSTIVLYRQNSDKARLYSIGIATQHRQYGIASQLCHVIETDAKQRGCAFLILEVRIDNAIAIQFYQKHGYDIFGTYKSFYEDGTDALRMKKLLSNKK